MSHPLGAWLKIKHLRLQPTPDRTTVQSAPVNLPPIKNENHFSLFSRSEREKSEKIKTDFTIIREILKENRYKSDIGFAGKF